MWKANYSRCGRTDKGVSALSQVRPCVCVCVCVCVGKAAIPQFFLVQVVSVCVRSNLLQGKGVVVPEGCRAQERSGVCLQPCHAVSVVLAGDKTTELPYMRILNQVLPQDIRVLCWAPVSADFSARYSCLQRTYKYFFPLGAMDIEVPCGVCVVGKRGGVTVLSCAELPLILFDCSFEDVHWQRDDGKQTIPPSLPPSSHSLRFL